MRPRFIISQQSDGRWFGLVKDENNDTFLCDGYNGLECCLDTPSLALSYLEEKLKNLDIITCEHRRHGFCQHCEDTLNNKTSIMQKYARQIEEDMTTELKEWLTIFAKDLIAEVVPEYKPLIRGIAYAEENKLATVHNSVIDQINKNLSEVIK